MHTLARLLVIWGLLLPMIAFPWMRNFEPQRGVLGSVRSMFEDFRGTRVIYKHVVTAGLVMTGLGLSVLAFRKSRDPEAAPAPGGGP